MTAINIIHVCFTQNDFSFSPFTSQKSIHEVIVVVLLVLLVWKRLEKSHMGVPNDIFGDKKAEIIIVIIIKLTNNLHGVI